MKNLRLPLAALLAPFSLGILLHGEVARATLTLDPAFGTGGIATVNIAGGVDVARGIAVQSDGALVLAGFSEQQTAGMIDVAYVTLTRLDGTTGAVDTTFGTAGNGIVTFLPVPAATSGIADGRALAIYNIPGDPSLDQKIIVAGIWKADPADSNQVFVARVDSLGVLDPGFGTGGVTLLTPAGVTDPTVNAVALRGDGSIILVGSGTKAGDTASVGTVVGLTSTGALDPAFTSAVIDNPLATGEGFRFNDVVILPGDGVLAAGGGGDLTLAQFTSTGAPDTGFDGDGIATFNFLTVDTAAGPKLSFDVATALAVSGGKIFLAGRFGSDASAATSPVLGRIMSSGALDTTFGSGGFAPLPVGTGQYPFGLGVRPSGDIVLAGQGFKPTQVSPNGIAVSPLAGSFTTILTDLEVLDSGDVVSSGLATVGGDNANSALAAVRLAATNLADGPDTVPDPFGFPTLTGLALGATATSSAVTITGIGAGVMSPVSVTFGEYSIGCTGTFISTAATIGDNQTVCVRAVASPLGTTAVTAVLDIGGVRGNFTIVTGDTAPDPFTFAPQTGLELGATATSGAATITGIGAGFVSPISVSTGDEYSIGCTGTFIKTPATIANNQSVCVRAVASQSGTTEVNAVLTIGGVPGTFKIVTGDATPDPFTFVAPPVAVANSPVTSAPITLTGLAISTDVAITPNGVYSAGCTGTFTSAVTRVAPGTQICVRRTSSVSKGGVVSATLTAGTGTVAAGKAVAGTFTITTAGDITPDDFSFQPQTVAKSTVTTSNTVTLTGFTSNSPIAVTGGTYSIGCTTSFASAPGTVAPNATVCVRHTSSAAGGTETITTLTVGAGPDLTAVSRQFITTTVGVKDTAPDPFSFPSKSGTSLAADVTSGAISIGGFDTNTTVSITGGTYSVGCGANFTANPIPRFPPVESPSFAPNTLICVRHTSAVTGGADTTTVLTVGGVSGTFTSTTLPGDAVPALFSFINQTGVDLYAPVTSAPVTITGIDIASPISVTDGEYSIGCSSTFTSTAASIRNGQSVCVRHTSSFASNTSVDTTLTISTVSGTFTSTTRSGDQTPDDFSFMSQDDVALGTQVTSSAITVTGVDSPVLVLASGPRDANNQPLFGFSVGCTGQFSANGTVVKAGDTVCISVQSAETDVTSVEVTVTIGGNTPDTQKSATFTVTTGDTFPDPFAFTDQVGVPLNETVYANEITITGITAPSRVTVSLSGQYQINCTGSFTRNEGVVKNNDTICVRQFGPSSTTTLTKTELTVGGRSATFTSTTTAEKSVPGGSAMDAWSLLMLAPLGFYRRRRSACRSACRSAFRRDPAIDRA